MTRRHWPAIGAARPGRALLIHGLSSIGDSWWQIGPALAAQGWDVTAIDQAGHGGRRAPSPISFDALADSVLADYPDGPQLLVGHSLGTLTALALLTRYPGWADVVVLEDPPGSIFDNPANVLGLARSIRADAITVTSRRDELVDRVRRECPAWADEDVEWAVEGIAQMDTEAYATWLETGTDAWGSVAQTVLAVDPVPFVIAAVSGRSFARGGSALLDPDRSTLRTQLPNGHFLEIPSGHCVHRDNPTAWLAALAQITSS